MNFELFQRLGDSVCAAYRRANEDERKFPDIAAEALSQAELPDDFSIHQVADFLRTTRIPQQPHLQFSALPAVVYRSDSFFIQMLVWTSATTTIHRHAFAGAFRVLAGGSLHAEYTFTERQRVSPLILIGESHLHRMEELHPGQVRTIAAGSEGFLHSLFHLVEPSVTLVVRTHALPWPQPQHSLLRPGLLYAPLELGTDPTVTLLGRAAAVAERMDPSAAAKLLLEQLPHLDFPRAFMVTRQNLALLQTQVGIDQVVTTVGQRHGALAEHLRELARESTREAGINHTRRVVVEPDLRYFLALLLNAPSQETIFEQLRQRFPDADPTELCAQWLSQISEAENPAKAFVELAQRAKLGDYRLSGKLSRILADGNPPERLEMIRSLLRGHDAKELLAGLKSRFASEPIDARSGSIRESFEALRNLLELEPLVKRS